MSLNAATKKVAVIKRALKQVKTRNWDVPPALCRLIEEAAAEASALLKNSGRHLHIIRPNQQHDPASSPPASRHQETGAAAAPGDAPEDPEHAPALAVSAAPRPGLQEAPDSPRLPTTHVAAGEGPVSHPPASPPSPADEAVGAPAALQGGAPASPHEAAAAG